MTPEQVTQLIQLVSQAPTQALLSVALYVMWRFATNQLITHLDWLHKEISEYTKRDRDLIRSIIEPSDLQISSKWQPLPKNGVQPPVS